MTKSNFRDWTLEKLEETFGLQQEFQHEVLDRIFAYEYTPTETEKFVINLLRENFQRNGGEDWNAAELKSKFISPLIVLSQIDNRKFSYFLERDLATTVGEYDLSGKVDGMIASGFRSPKKPFFCLHEYKRESDPNGDPKGQVLVAMLAAQTLNTDEKPVLGCYIVGKNWRFIVLDGLKYAFSPTLLADSDDIFDLLRLLKALRYEIEQTYFPTT
jgi:hypothetical protein